MLLDLVQRDAGRTRWEYAAIRNTAPCCRPYPRERQRLAKMFLNLSLLKTVFSIDGRAVEAGKQPAFCLGQMHVGGARLTMSG
jgi:hypothetical protein